MDKKNLNNPLVSFVVFAYNQEEYIREAVLSALAQTYEPLEILITDDSSSDGTFRIIKETVNSYGGSHKIILNRNEKNLGLAESFNIAFSRTHGDLCVVQAGDDISVPERTAELVELWMSKKPRPDLVFSNIIRINYKGVETKRDINVCVIPSLDDVIKGEWFIAGGMACAYSRNIMTRFGPLDRRILVEDLVLTFRAMVGNGILHTAKPLVLYRAHDNSIMAKWRNKVSEREYEAKAKDRRIAEAKDKLNTWLKSEHRNSLFAWRLRRHVAHERLNAFAASSGRSLALAAFFWALFTIRPRCAANIFQRDILRK